MLQTWRREGGGLLPTSTFPVGMHLPGCLREVPSALFDSTSKQKVLIKVFSPELFHTDATRTLGQQQKPGHLNSALTHSPEVTQELEPRSPKAFPTSSTSSRHHIQL